MSEGEVLHIKVQGEVFELDMSSLTWGEVSELEEVAFGGLSIEAMNLESARGVVGIAWLARRRKYPDTILDDIRALKMGEVELVEGPTEAVDGGGETEQPGNPS